MRIFALMRPSVVVAATRTSLSALGCVAPSVIEYRRRAGVDVNDHVEYYDIRGRTLGELRIDARRNGPVASDTTFFAVTHTQIHWTYNYYRQPSLCRLTNVHVVVDAIVTLPRWVDSSSVDPAAVRWWMGASDRVRSHEAQHLQIAVDGAAEIHSLLQRQTSSDCGLLRENANEGAGEVLRRVAEQQRELDRVTRHGTLLPAVSASKH